MSAGMLAPGHGVVYSRTPVGTRWACDCGENARGDFIPHDLAVVQGRLHAIEKALEMLSEAVR